MQIWLRLIWEQGFTFIDLILAAFCLKVRKKASKLNKK